MTPKEILRNVTEAEIGREIIRLAPHWYEAECGPEKSSIPIGESVAEFYSHCKLTPNLKSLLTTICDRTRELPVDRFVEYPGLTDILLESFTTEWLRMFSSEPDWVRLIKYLETVSRRTHENLPVALTLVVRPGKGLGDITQPHLQKFFDRLASSPFSTTYLAVSPDLQLMDYGSVEWSQVNNAESYRLYPEFLHPIHSVIDDQDIVAHLTQHGDLVIMNKAGVLATKRKRKWKIYDIRTFKDNLAYCMGSSHVGANLLEIVFDLSFRRQGALLIYDPEHRISEHILNPESVILPDRKKDGQSDRTTECGQTLIGHSIRGIAAGKKAGSLKRKWQLIEMACIDGAVVFDDSNILAVGALIRSHPNVGNQLGARKTAARSAYLWGGHPINVSSDGDVTIFFKSRNGDQECDAVMKFL